ncbi:Hypothetical protein R9X50_00669900 [Acrodontium crateriforme]|uniref:Stress-associated endoplasmic reticulum protein n=1 Tax=Acrodontium crateriforme TaxID=150365 RepID=A0AAQ3R6Z9_9PEZI|nr:Hypothetical protein R9X50_00669900 [Acrodontium crateriforme]
MAQTPQQRRANEAFAKSEAAKRGKPAETVERIKAKRDNNKPQKAPISKVWVYTLLFVVCGGIVFELLRIVFGRFL